MADRRGLVVVGGGQAGFQVAASARAAGYQEPIMIIAREQEYPYQRPPLSKAYLLGKQTREGMALQKASFYEAQGIAVLIGRQAVAIDRHGGAVELAGRDRVAFRHLVLATGAGCRTLPVPGAGLDGIFTLRDLADADLLSERLDLADEVAIVGGGFIGLEFAAVARSLGRRVTVVEAAGRPMARAVAEPVSAFFRREHEARGVRFHFGVSVERFEGDNGRVRRVVLADGTRCEAGLVLMGVGVSAEAGLAQQAGLAVSGGIEVDATLRTGDPRIFAIGDCAAFSVPGLGRMRIESVSNAVDQGRYAGAALTAAGAPYSSLPWFWSDQFEHKLQMAGLGLGADRHVLRGDPTGGAFSVFGYRGDRLAAVDSVNRPLDHALARKLLSAGGNLSPEEAADESIDLRGLLKARLAA